MKYAALVYQAGIANVFELQAMTLTEPARVAQLLFQSDFRACENFARGLKAAGVQVTTAACNQAGDIKHSTWCADLDEHPFSDKFRPVFS